MGGFFKNILICLELLLRNIHKSDLFLLGTLGFA